ncbi:substrate-binding domain-containing protein [Streptomyces sp. INA 01156]
MHPARRGVGRLQGDPPAPGRRSHPHRVHQPRPGDPGGHRQGRGVRTCPARGRDHPRPLPRRPGWATADSAYTAACELLDRPAGDRPTALFCGNDRMAMGAYEAIKERGLRIPHDVAVVGFDNQELIAAYLRPKLTTLALPFEAMGTKGIDMLAALAAGQPLDTRQVTIDCPLLERSSV